MNTSVHLCLPLPLCVYVCMCVCVCVCVREREREGGYSRSPEKVKTSSLVITLRSSQQNIANIPTSPRPHGSCQMTDNPFCQAVTGFLPTGPSCPGSSLLRNKNYWDIAEPVWLLDSSPSHGSPLLWFLLWLTQHKAKPFRRPFLWPQSFQCAPFFATDKPIKLALCVYECIPGSLSSVSVSIPLKSVQRPGGEVRETPKYREKTITAEHQGSREHSLIWDKHQSFCHSSVLECTERSPKSG